MGMSGQGNGRPSGPSRVWYWVAGAAVVASVVWLAAGLFFGIRGFSRQVEGFQRVPVPGEAELSFDAPGGYTVYYEGLGAADEQVAIPSLSVSLVPVGGGGEVPVYPYSGSATYSVGRRSGRAVGPSGSIRLVGSSFGPRETSRVGRPTSPSAPASLRPSSAHWA